jgi:plasmid stabilization system protein ParE
MSLRVSSSHRAEADLAHQYRWYIDNASVEVAEVAEGFLAAFDATVGTPAQQPSLGRSRKFRAPELAGIRSFPVGGRFGVHLIFYRIAGQTLAIERVMHGARDLPRRLLEAPENS